MQMIEVSKLIPHPRNNEFFDDIEGGKWEDFKKSVSRRGVVEAITVSQDLVIISGHQRVRACKELNMLEIPCRITHYPDIDENTGNTKEDAILEDLISTNILQRGIGNINPMKMAKCIIQLENIFGIKQGGNGSNQYKNVQNGNNFPLAKTQKDIAEQINLTEKQLRNYKSLINLIPELQELVGNGEIKGTTAYKIYAKLSPIEQEELLNKLKDEDLSKITQKQTQKLVSEMELLQKEKNELAQKNTELLKKQCDVYNVKEQIKILEEDLEKERNKEILVKEITIEIETIPEDYEDVKKKLKDSKQYYNDLKSDYDKKIKQLNDLKQEIDSLKSVTEEDKYAKKLKESAIFFCSRVNDFIEKTGGFVWLSDNINELPEFERKSYIKAIEMVENWATAMKMNMKNYIN